MSDRDLKHKAAADVLVQMEAAPQAGEADHYRAVFDALTEGLCVLEMISSDEEPADYRFIEVNGAFEEATGLRDVTGATYRELMPPMSILAPESYDRIARTGTPERFVADSEARSGARRFDVYAFRLGEDGSRRVAVHFTDVTQRTLTEQELVDRTEQFSSLIERAPIGVFLVDAAFRLVHANPMAEEALGEVPDLIGRDFEEVMRLVWRTELAEDVVRAFRLTLETGVPNYEQSLATTVPGRGVDAYYDWRIDRLLLRDGHYGVVCYFSDVSPIVAARNALASSNEHYRAVFDKMEQRFCVVEVLFDDASTPVDCRYLEVNSAFGRQTGMTDVVGRTMRELMPDMEASWFQVYGTIALTGASNRFMEYAETLDRWFDVTAIGIGEPAEHKVAILFHDVTERKQAELALQQSVMQLRHRAHHDHLTGLPNRILFEERLQLALAEAARYERRLAVLFIDLDGFKEINDSHGHSCGDVVLEEVAQRLQDTLRTSDTLARMHGDEFVVLLPDVGDPHDVGHLARTLLSEVARPVGVGDDTVSVSASIGVSLFPHNATNAQGLLHAADAAMYQAKASGRNAVRYFGSSLHPVAKV